jgi:hypothetical protein
LGKKKERSWEKKKDPKKDPGYEVAVIPGAKTPVVVK